MFFELVGKAFLISCGGAIIVGAIVGATQFVFNKLRARAIRRDQISFLRMRVSELEATKELLTLMNIERQRDIEMLETELKDWRARAVHEARTKALN